MLAAMSPERRAFACPVAGLSRPSALGSFAEAAEGRIPAQCERVHEPVSAIRTVYRQGL